MGTGLICDENGKKFSTSKGGNVKLNDLLDEARDRAIIQLKERYESDDYKGTKIEESEIERVGEIMGIAAVRYYDMRQKREQNYNFTYDNMLAPKGDTAIYLLYSYARLCSVVRKSGLSKDDLKDFSKFKISHEAESTLLSHIAKFTYMIEATTKELSLNKLCDYTYQLASIISTCYSKYKILDNEDSHSRVMVIEMVRITMETCLHLLGITPLEKI